MILIICFIILSLMLIGYIYLPSLTPSDVIRVLLTFIRGQYKDQYDLVQK